MKERLKELASTIWTLLTDEEQIMTSYDTKTCTGIGENAIIAHHEQAYAAYQEGKSWL